ncbi:peptide deformylase [Candidatus Gracilibacteria bacterium]|nr:peptide deformylase [Candidatus Gracilibacteria bacterium]
MKINIETGEKNTILRSISEPVKKDEVGKYAKLGKEMVKYIKDPKNRGIGLAAPQAGYNKRVIAVGLIPDWDFEGSFPYVAMINPTITQHSHETEIDDEGCLSVPGAAGMVERWKDIDLEYLNEKGKKISLKLSGTPARVVLDGILFTDKLVK